jgi:predicted DNA-binding transcriptional regulator YafY
MLELILLFQKGKRLSTYDIAETFNVSIRTAQRYVQMIKKTLPLQKDILNKYYIKEKISINDKIALKAIKLYMKNIGLLDSYEESYFYAKLDVEKIDLELFNILEKAIIEKKELHIFYKKEKLETKLIKPLKILNFEGYWYVSALNEQNQYRTFHIKSIKNIKLTSKTFKIKKDILNNLDYALNIWYDPLKEPFLVELQVDNSIVKYLQRIPLSKTQKIIPQKNYSIIELKITHPNEIKRTLLSWLPHIVILHPKWLKEEMDKEIKSYYKNYIKQV